MMLSYLTIFVASFTIALTGAMMPGPLLTSTITESLRHGFIAAPLLMVGHGLLEMALVIGLLMGLSPLFHQSWFFVTVSFGGGIILLGMAWSIWRTLPTLRLVEVAEGRDAGHNLILKGITISLANPYFTIWWATIGLSYIVHSKPLGGIAIAAFFAGHLAADCLWYGAVSLALAKGRRFLNPRLYRGAMACGALVLAFFACYFIYAGWERVRL